MCLYTKTSLPLIAEKDIECYKVVKKEKGWFKSYHTLYQDTLIPKTVIRGKKPFKAEGKESISPSYTVRFFDIEGKKHCLCFLKTDDFTESNFIEGIKRQAERCYGCVSDTIEIINSKYVIEGGFIHTYREKPYMNSDKKYIFKCIIPKGTPYYIGEDDDYASKEIVFREKV